MAVIGERPEITLDRIVVATDFSPVALNAARYGAALARRYSSRLTLLNVVDLSGIAASMGTLVGPAIDILKTEQEHRLREAAKELHGLSVDIQLLEEFSPATAILHAVSDASLLVMGTSAKDGITKVVLGSVAEQVLRSVACPVLTIGPNVRELHDELVCFREILFATDFTAQAAKAAPLALAFAEDSTANLYLCHVLPEHHPHSLDERNSYMTALERTVPRSAFDWCNPQCAVEYGKASEALLKLADDVEADLLVLGARKASFWLEYVHTGLTPALLASAKCPVLTIS